MTKKIQFRPEGFQTVNPYLAVNGAAQVLDFLIKAFGAVEVGARFKGPDGAIMHAALRIGDSMVEVSDAPGEPMPAALHMYVEDTDAAYRRAMEAGGTSLREPMTTFYGDRSAGVKDPGGNSWWIACHVEDVSQEEMVRRMKAQSKEGHGD
ncbi:MAG: glyoxalase [Acidobacteria bacterium]|nr:MAG: glyoxalase [Acidobacteriota bacterium]